jgi:hypothetical protein
MQAGKRVLESRRGRRDFQAVEKQRAKVPNIGRGIATNKIHRRSELWRDSRKSIKQACVFI